MSAPRPTGRLPDFIVIGAMKSGSTSLYASLADHPHVFMCHPKEPGFFSREEIYARGLDWYRSLFADARPDQLCGEASTCYSRAPHFGDVPGRMAAAVPEARLVYVMRHPVERAYSHYVHLMHERRLLDSGPVVPLAEALEGIPEIIDASCYVDQIDRYREHFPRERLHLLLLDDLLDAPEATLAALARFLELPAPDLRTIELDNRAGDRVATARARDWVDRVRDGHVARPLRLVPKSLRSRTRALLTRPGTARLLMRRSVARENAELAPLDPESRSHLVERLAEPTHRLGRLLGRDLSGWTRRP